jgi:hypothetical protein
MCMVRQCNFNFAVTLCQFCMTMPPSHANLTSGNDDFHGSYIQFLYSTLEVQNAVSFLPPNLG